MESKLVRREEGMKKRAKILIVEDDPDQVRLYSKGLRAYRISAVSNELRL